MGKDRNIEVLTHKIAELDVKIANLEKEQAPSKKMTKLQMLKMEYEDKLSELQYA